MVICFDLDNVICKTQKREFKKNWPIDIDKKDDSLVASSFLFLKKLNNK